MPLLEGQGEKVQSLTQYTDYSHLRVAETIYVWRLDQSHLAYGDTIAHPIREECGLPHLKDIPIALNLTEFDRPQ